MQYILLSIILLISPAVLGQKLKKQKLNDNITVRIPESFMSMSEGDKQQRYGSGRIPIALYTDPDRMVDFGINRTFSTWQANDLKMLQDFYEATILELYDKVDFIDKGIKSINEHDYVVFEFESVVYPENDFQRNIAKYTYLMYGLEGGTTYLFNFTAELSVSAKWKTTAHKIMESVKLK
jgi:hypothetical protein